MPRGGHRTGYNYGVPDRDKAQIKIPKEIKDKVEEYAHKLWEEHKQSMSENKENENENENDE